MDITFSCTHLVILSPKTASGRLADVCQLRHLGINMTSSLLGFKAFQHSKLSTMKRVSPTITLRLVLIEYIQLLLQILWFSSYKKTPLVFPQELAVLGNSVFLKACFRIVFLPHVIYSFISYPAQFIDRNAQGFNECFKQQRINKILVYQNGCFHLSAFKTIRLFM